MTRLTHEQFIRCFGPANCWTGSVGEACCRIKELLGEAAALRAENERLLQAVEEMSAETERLRKLLAKF
jgi:hypothetical protein